MIDDMKACGIETAAYSRPLHEQFHYMSAADAMRIGRHGLTPALLAPFQGWNRALLDSVLAFNGTSCALSNFPEDHRPDAELQKAATLDLAAAWREFALELNGRLVDAATAARVSPAGTPA